MTELDDDPTTYQDEEMGEGGAGGGVEDGNINQLRGNIMQSQRRFTRKITKMMRRTENYNMKTWETDVGTRVFCIGSVYLACNPSACVGWSRDSADWDYYRVKMVHCKMTPVITHPYPNDTTEKVNPGLAGTMWVVVDNDGGDVPDNVADFQTRRDRYMFPTNCNPFSRDGGRSIRLSTPGWTRTTDQGVMLRAPLQDMAQTPGNYGGFFIMYRSNVMRPALTQELNFTLDWDMEIEFLGVR